MKNTIILISLISLLFTSCNQPNQNTHVSYETLNRFLKSKNLDERFDVQKIDISSFQLIDSHHYDVNRKLSRVLNAHYQFKIIGNKKNYSSKAIIKSIDSINWKLKSLVLTEKEVKDKAKIENTYMWSDTSDYKMSQNTIIEELN
jgi:uncharacterized protein YnzC (UPF0291/DUF896 family)